MTTNPKATELCAELELDDAARALLRAEHEPRQFVEALVEAKLYVDAIKVLARALPKRSAVEWACACIRPELDDTATEVERACLAAAEAWVAEPDEEHRLAAQRASDASGHDTASAWAATAAAWSGGSLGPSEVPPIPPPEHLCGVAVFGAIGLAASRVPEEIEERQSAFLRAGLAMDAVADSLTTSTLSQEGS